MAAVMISQTTHACWQPHSSAAGDCTLGEEVAADDPRRLANPQLFIEKDVPRGAWPDWFDLALERGKPEVQALEALEEAERNPIRVAAPELVEATADFHAAWQGRPALIQKGSVVHADDPLALEFPQHFKPVGARR